MSFKILLSPAKSLDFETPIPTSQYTIPVFLKESEKINKVLKSKKPDFLSDLMDISVALAKLNWERNQQFNTPFTSENARQAIYAFNGDVYEGLNARTLKPENIDYLQEHLLILSGLYGLLQPLDLIQAYRLEMGTQIPLYKKKNLYGFWSDKITKTLNSQLDKNDYIINLASKEYFSVVNTKKLKATVISPVFKDYKNGQLKIISFFAKKARGLMTRYLAENHIENPELINEFSLEGYRFSATETKNKNEPVFVR
ncbi:MAG: hypothetical protein CO119_06705 [Flavobacteriales bacterium CG_4_9_14_3_um_filter_40_17]|nr:MAG: hypothetical protein CO119_06705 [Flavobacteriales bacterium CG_4_9_14_3_um_filter_40_17]